MIWLLLIVAYLLISNFAIIYKLYRSTLQYFNPLKGYLTSILLIGSLLALDVEVVNFAYDKIEKAQEVQITQEGNARIIGVSLRR